MVATLSVANLFDRRRVEFVGASRIGRLGLARLRVEL
jgi:hypothetical protein